jgi:DNA-directed RNA polymerase subunit RPC12/RpoP
LAAKEEFFEEYCEETGNEAQGSRKEDEDGNQGLREGMKNNLFQRSLCMQQDLSTEVLSRPEATTNSSRWSGSVATEGSKAFVCTKCTTTFTRKGDLDRHYRFQHNTKLYECSKCGKGFTYQGHPKKHMLAVCDDQKSQATSSPYSSLQAFSVGSTLFRCDICPATFSVNGKGNLNQHYRLKHGMRLYGCSECDKKFTHQHDQLKHFQTGCEGEKRHLPTTTSSLLPRSSSKTSTKPFACLTCPSTFGKGKDLNRHYRLMHNTHLSACYECDVKFTFQRDLREHQQTSCNNKVQKPQETDFDPFEPPSGHFSLRVLKAGEKEQGKTPFDPFQPPTGVPDMRPLSSAEQDKILEKLGMRTPDPKEEKHVVQWSDTPPAISEERKTARGNSRMREKSGFMITDLSITSSSTSLASDEDILIKWKGSAHSEKAPEEKVEGKERRPTSPIVLIITQEKKERVDSKDGIACHTNKETDDSEYELAFPGKRQPLKRARIGSEERSSLLAQKDAWDSEEELAFPGKKRRLLKRSEFMRLKGELV